MRDRRNVAPPGIPRYNDTFSTVTWSQTQYGDSALFCTITVWTDGSYAERLAVPPETASPERKGRLRPQALAELRRLATDRQLAAEARWSGLFGGPDCTDAATEMGQLRLSARDCGEWTAEVLPTFEALSRWFIEIGSHARPPGGA